MKANLDLNSEGKECGFMKVFNHKNDQILRLY